MDLAVLEVTGITEEGYLVPSVSLDVSPALVESSNRILLELNVSKQELTGLHDVYLPRDRTPIPVSDVHQRIGELFIRCPPSKIVGLVVSESEEESALAYSGLQKQDLLIANHVTEFLSAELKRGRLPRDKLVLQPGAGPLASALGQTIPFSGFDVWAEGVPTDWIDLVGDTVRSLSTSCVYSLPGEPVHYERFLDRLLELKDSVVLRPYEVTNSLEVVSRLNVVSVQQAIEADIYGNVNVSHVNGNLYNGVGGSGDFTRAAYITIVAMPSTTNDMKISRIVPTASHVDIPEHDVDVVATERGWVDLRGLSPTEKASLVIERCAHPNFKDQITQQFERMCAQPGHEPIDPKPASQPS